MAGSLRHLITTRGWLAMPAPLACAAVLAAAQAPAIAAAAPAAVPAGTISTVAGGTGGPAPARSVAVAPCAYHPSQAVWCGMTFASGRLLLTDLGRGVIRSIAINGGLLTTPAGDAAVAEPADGDLATSAGLTFPADVAVDQDGNTVIADLGDGRVRVVAAATGTFYGIAMTAGHIYAVAGNGSQGQVADGQPALGQPIHATAVTVDGAGNLVLEDVGSGLGIPGPAVRVVATRTGTFYGRAMTAGDVYRIAGWGSKTADGVPAVQATLGSRVGSVRLDHHGNVVIAERSVGRIRVVAETTGRFYGLAMTKGDIYTVAGGGNPRGIGDGGPAVKARLSDPVSTVADAAGNLVVADNGNNRVRVVAVQSGRFYGRSMTKGDIYTVAGGGSSLQNGSPATKAFLSHPYAVAVDSAGNVALCDYLARRLRIVAERAGTFYGVAMRPGHVYAIAGTGQVWLSGNGGPATHGQLIPEAETIGRGGNLLVADGGYRGAPQRSQVRLVTASTGTFFGQSMTAGDIYTIAGSGHVGFSGDGGPAVHASLRLSAYPDSVLAASAAGNLIMADTGNNRIRVVADRAGTFYGRAMKAGDIYTVAGTGAEGYSGDGGPALKAGLEFFEGVAVAADRFGNIIISDPTQWIVRMVAARTGTFYGLHVTAGNIYRIAGTVNKAAFSGDGGPARNAEFIFPYGVATDGAGNLAVSDGSRIRVVAAVTGTFYGQAMTAGDIYTVAGNGNGGDTGDGGPALDAGLYTYSVQADPAGNLLFVPASASWVRIVAARTGTFYGLPMTAGDIYLAAGSHTTGFSGDGGPATAARLSFLSGLAAGSAGMYIADGGNVRIRLVRA